LIQSASRLKKQKPRKAEEISTQTAVRIEKTKPKTPKGKERGGFDTNNKFLSLSLYLNLPGRALTRFIRDR
jgi:hypothetical protein